MNPVLTTERTTLRLFNEDDVHEMAKIFADPEVQKFSAHGVMTFEQTQGFINYVSQPSDCGIRFFAVIHDELEKLIGYCALIKREVDGKKEVELAYRFAKKFWGQGFATETAKALRDYAFDSLGLKRIISLIEPENIASIRVAEKVGMTLKGNSELSGKNVNVYVLKNLNYPNPRLTIRMMIKDWDENVKAIILEKLNLIVKQKYDNHIKIKFMSSESYWKFPDETDCVFGVYPDLVLKDITVNKFKDLFGVKWYFRRPTNIDESAVWNKYMKNDSLVDEKVTWVDICNMDKEYELED